MAEEFFAQVWTEKYRPQTLDDVVGQKEIVGRLKSFVKNKTLQNLLFAGPAGTGKTTCSIAIARELFGENWKGNFLELNASDERGIDVVRNKVKDFARTKPLGSVPYKIIYLDESDALTREAQQALRRTMENYTHTCRFILACNYSSKLIDPIQSRCALFRFAPLKDEEVEAHLMKVAKNEGIELTTDGVKALVEIVRGDLRTSINLFQAASATTKKVTADVIYQIAAKAKPKDVEEAIDLALKGDFVKAKDQIDSLLIDQGIAGQEVIRQIHRVLIGKNLPSEQLAPLLDKLGEYDYRIIEGSDERIQLNALLAQIYALSK